jgi:hypothetical protein
MNYDGQELKDVRNEYEDVDSIIDDLQRIKDELRALIVDAETDTLVSMAEGVHNHIWAGILRKVLREEK